MPEQGQTPLHVLLIEDSQTDEKLLTYRLREGGYEPIVHRVETREAMLFALQNHQFQVVISDYRLPDFSGPEALLLLREVGTDLPFIIVSGTVGETNAVEAMKAGAHDYVMKDNLTRLAPAIGRELIEAQVRRDRRRAEVALRESEQRFRSMADSAPMLLWVADEQGQVTYVNKPWLTFTGRSLDEELGTGWLELIHPDEITLCKRRIVEAFSSSSPFQVEYRLRRSDGSWRWFLNTGTPRLQHGSEFAGFIGTCIDVTDRKTIEIEREHIRVENERLLKERTAAALQQRAFLKDVLFSVSEGKLRLCDSIDELPSPFEFSLKARVAVTSSTLRELRVSVEAAAATIGFSNDRTMDLITAVGEASMNAAVHAGGGEARVYIRESAVQVWIEDRGMGIDIARLPRATLERGYTTANSLGHGFFMMLNCADEISLLTGPKGTTVVVVQNFERPEPAWLNPRQQDLAIV